MNIVRKKSFFVHNLNFTKENKNVNRFIICPHTMLTICLTTEITLSIRWKIKWNEQKLIYGCVIFSLSRMLQRFSSVRFTPYNFRVHHGFTQQRMTQLYTVMILVRKIGSQTVDSICHDIKRFYQLVAHKVSLIYIFCSRENNGSSNMERVIEPLWLYHELIELNI